MITHVVSSNVEILALNDR